MSCASSSTATNGCPEDFDEVVAPDYRHTPPGRGPGGARDDYENAVSAAKTGPIVYQPIEEHAK
jgi:hypothetical protein